MAPPRAYIASVLPLEFQSEVVVTNASLGPARFSIRSKYSNWEYLSMCLELEVFELDHLPAYPVKGTPCIAKISENLHRGLVLSTNWDQNSSNICLVDFDCVHAVSHDMLFQIPDEIMLYPMFSTTVALADGEALSQKPGLNEIFSTVVSIPDYLKCEVVEVVGTLQKVILYTPKDEDIAKIVLGLHNNLAPKYRASSPAIPKIETPPATSISSSPKSAFASALRIRSPHASTRATAAFGNTFDRTSTTASAGRLDASPNVVYENRSVFRSSGSIEIPVRSPVPSAPASAAFGQQRSTEFGQTLVQPAAFGRAPAFEGAPWSTGDFTASPMIGRMGSGASQNAAGTNRFKGSNTFGVSSTAERSSAPFAMSSPEFGQENSTGLGQSTACGPPLADESIVHEENGITSLKEDQDNKSASTDLLVYQDGVNDEIPDSKEEEEQDFDVVFINDLKPQQLTDEESITELVNVYGVIEEESPSGLEEHAVELVNKQPTPVQSFETSTTDIKQEKVNDPRDSSPVLLPPLHLVASATNVKQAESASSVTEKENKKEAMAKEEQKLESNIETNQKMMEQSFSSSVPTPDQSVLDDTSNLDPFNASMVSNSEEKSGDVDEQSASDFMTDSFMKELLNGTVDSQSDWENVVGTNLSMIEKVLDDSAEDSVITNSGENDEIPFKSILTVETEKEETDPLGFEPVEEASSLIAPAGLEE